MPNCRENFAAFLCFAKKVLNFLQNEIGMTPKYEIQLSENMFTGSLAFVTFLTENINHFNIFGMKLQGRMQSLFQIFGHIEGFRKQHVLSIICLEKITLPTFLHATN